MKEKYHQIGEQLAQEQGTFSSQMFGKPCLKKGKKAFAVFYEDEMVFKVGREEVEMLLQKYTGSKRFDPSKKDRPMKDWLQVPAEYNEDWLALARQAMEFTEDSK
ncbi:MAG: TfoX/Sxy family protein [Bacteroidota bacterium]